MACEEGAMEGFTVVGFTMNGERRLSNRIWANQEVAEREAQRLTHRSGGEWQYAVVSHRPERRWQPLRVVRLAPDEEEG